MTLPENPADAFEMLWTYLYACPSIGPCVDIHPHGPSCRSSGLRLRTSIMNDQPVILLEGLLHDYQGWHALLSVWCGPLPQPIEKMTCRFCGTQWDPEKGVHHCTMPPPIFQ